MVGFATPQGQRRLHEGDRQDRRAPGNGIEAKLTTTIQKNCGDAAVSAQTGDPRGGPAFRAGGQWRMNYHLVLCKNHVLRVASTRFLYAGIVVLLLAVSAGHRDLALGQDRPNVQIRVYYYRNEDDTPQVGEPWTVKLNQLVFTPNHEFNQFWGPIQAGTYTLSIAPLTIYRVDWAVQPTNGASYMGQTSPDASGAVAVEITGQSTNLTIFVKPGESDERLPVIFLPGVAGTVLTDGTFELWPLAPLGDRAGLALDHDGKTSALGKEVEVGDILRRTGMNFYGSFVDSLKKLGYVADKTLYVFPYDWRYSNDVQFEPLDRLIGTALQRSGKTKVVLIAHSMGGVIARAYVYSNPARAAKVESFITMGTPYWGAPKVYYGAINGYQFGNPSVRQELMKILIQNYPSAYQLMPRIPFIELDKGPDLSLDESNAIHYKWFLSVQYDIRGRDRYDVGTKNTQTFNQELVQQAAQFFAAVGTLYNPNPLPAGVKQYSIIGTGVGTLGGYHLKEWEPGSFEWLFPSSDYLELGDGRKVVLRPVSMDGDGTVPLWSLQTTAATAQYYLTPASGSTAHGDLPANPAAQSIVAQVLQHHPPDPTAYRPPPEYMGNFPLRPGKELENMAEFELHSDAHLQITANGQTLGFNSSGGIDESLPGTFLAMDGVEYASVADLKASYDITVTGIQDGEFTLDVNVKEAGKNVAQFSYADVPVKQGTVAQVTLSPASLAAAPPLSVASDGRTVSIPAVVKTMAANPSGNTPAPSPTMPAQPTSPSQPSATVASVVADTPYDGVTFSGQNLRYYPLDNYQQCSADCAREPNCRAWSWVKPGGYKEGDSAMCYLVARVDSEFRHTCCISGVKAGAASSLPGPAPGLTPTVTSPGTPASSASIPNRP